MRLAVFRKDFMELLRRLVAVGRAGLLGHLDAAVGHEGALEGLVGLKADNLLKVFGLGIDVTGAVGRHRADNLGLHVEHAALEALLPLQLLQLAPEDIGCLRGALEETLVAVIGSVVVLNKITHIHFVEPFHALEASPFISHTVYL